MNLSIVVPLYNEEESLPELCSWIKSVVDQHGYTYEVLLIDDGSRDDSWKVIQTIAASNPNIKGIKFQRNYGKSAALNEGFKAAQGDVVITMDADMQDSPDEIPALYQMIVEEGFDMVSGWKKKRYDNTLTKNIPSKLFNAVARKSSGIKLHDFNCGLKAYKRKVVKCIEVFGEMHRYIPVLAKWSGFRKIGEKIVEHRPRKYGTTKFGWDRFINGFLDLGTIMFLGKFGKKPMQFFGLYGTLAFLIGFLTSGYLMVAKILDPEVGITNKPAFYIALAVMIIGMQLFLTGFVAELVARNASERNVYLIEEKLGLEEA
ncbi:MAG: glycosyltransferase [Sphingobacteriia bacterium 24-36-13]|jgi:glycosyltransferase involved in cell wall biosynthesis|uniref:glycosyltransferase family 2 protein n=1 Tax=Sediminibacterium sp. TaxID=1917865 RepID=UPI000BC9322C|nr:glycosyltransferase family 2 protein [Sediminibacterium sp.]OYY12129.1 MAG: glycosyltransferase [Sphingobacteriia bacterium 35-36-14]OYZ55695.1 MAG: glycosyltransferase [Sphingobacteriia bacterium 24-36-13]OZA65382.1 MAG: glycosyltransferase [Sphingobacteriia bacterium 39-36-14]HQS23230.1 glycosyltransferase family 2 protein [Sediminibacterium sp.]HQS34789.1 glycosyltransferase family 2 protein [Sediminibacterium sp.]